MQYALIFYDLQLILARMALREGAADEHIVAYAQEHAIDLIVMSTHGYSGFKRFFLGSVTDRVLRAGQTPVLVVPTS